MRVLQRRVLSAVAMATVMATAVVARAGADETVRSWMSGDDMRQSFAGADTAGLYPTGKAWREMMHADGRADYSEPGDDRKGNWWINGAVLCYAYGRPGTGGCFQVVRLSANCFDMYVRREQPSLGAPPSVSYSYNGKMWRNDQPSTCDEKPSV